MKGLMKQLHFLVRPISMPSCKCFFEFTASLGINDDVMQFCKIDYNLKEEVRSVSMQNFRFTVHLVYLF